MNRIISDLLSLSKIEIDMYKELVDEVNIIDQINTAKNALEHRASESGKMINVTIKGAIPRINEEHLPRLTERFYRVDKARSRDIGGTGLGLAIVKHILIRHSANMEITSKINGKTKFIISFPCR